MDAYLAIVSKREVRRYADRPVPEDVQRHILEAGRVSGSSANKQQRRFVVVESPDMRQQLSDHVYTASNITGAPFVVAITSRGAGPAAFDAGRAAQNMMLAAWSEGVGSCPNGMPDRPAVGELLGLEAGEEPAIVVSFGYPARPVDPTSRSAEAWIAAADRVPFDEAVKRV